MRIQLSLLDDEGRNTRPRVWSQLPGPVRQEIVELYDRELAGVGKTPSENCFRHFVVKHQCTRWIDNKHGHRETAGKVLAQDYLDLFGKHSLPPHGPHVLSGAQKYITGCVYQDSSSLPIFAFYRKQKPPERLEHGYDVTPLIARSKPENCPDLKGFLSGVL